MPVPHPSPPQQAVLFLNCCPITKIDKFPTYVQLIINMYRQEDFTAIFLHKNPVTSSSYRELTTMRNRLLQKCRSTYSDQSKHYCRKVLHNHLLDLIDIPAHKRSFTHPRRPLSYQPLSEIFFTLSGQVNQLIVWFKSYHIKTKKQQKNNLNTCKNCVNARERRIDKLGMWGGE